MQNVQKVIITRFEPHSDMSCDNYYIQKAQRKIKCEVAPSQPQAVDVVPEASLLNIVVVFIVFDVFVVL